MSVTLSVLLLFANPQCTHLDVSFGHLQCAVSMGALDGAGSLLSNVLRMPTVLFSQAKQRVDSLLVYTFVSSC